MSVPAESWAVEGISGSNGHPGSSLWALGSQRTNKQRHHCRKAMTCPRRVSQKPWEEITISLPPSMSCASGGHWYNLISFQYHSCKGFWEFFFFKISNLCRWKGYEKGHENTHLRPVLDPSLWGGSKTQTHLGLCSFCIPPFQVVSVCFSASPKQASPPASFSEKPSSMYNAAPIPSHSLILLQNLHSSHHSRCVCVSHSVVSDSATPWSVAHQAPLSMGFSRQEYWNEMPFPSLEDLANLGIKPRSPAFQAGSLPSVPPGKPLITHHLKLKPIHLILSLHTRV